MYHFISGYTAKVAGTEMGVTEPVATFSACFGAAFMPLHPTKYAEILGENMRRDQVNVWLINTGWIGGPYGVGQRISLAYTRAMITAALEGQLDHVEYATEELLGLAVPTFCPNVPSELLSQRHLWKDMAAYEAQAQLLAQKFNKNFQKYADYANEEIKAGGPRMAALV